VRQVVRTENAPEPVGPYSQAVVVGNLVWTSGQIGIDPQTGKLVSGGIETETEQVLKNLVAVLAAAGSGLDRVIKTTIFITDMNEFARVNAIYARYFQEPYPARSTVQVSALPKGAAVEIEVVAER
jgi:2-iminobutanoate/2-iminopropanoate deaminase